MNTPLGNSKCSPVLSWRPLPYLTDELPGVGGTLKVAPEDFEVEEIPAYEPSGAGEHLFLWIEKRDVSAEQLTQHVAHRLGIAGGDVGVAGLKDRRAVTRQFVSVPARCEAAVANIDTDAIRVLRAERHGNKLRTGHLRGNLFSILIRDVTENAGARAEIIARKVTELGFPNYFGTQRFGEGGETARLGFELLKGRMRPRDLPAARRRFLLRLALSAAQSWLFNRALADRLADGLLHQVLVGDVMCVVASGGCFIAENIETEQRRLNAGETVVSGPIFGPKMKQPADIVAEREATILRAFDLQPADFLRHRKLTLGTRRPYVIHPGNLTVETATTGLGLRFTLPSGAYATELLREFQKG
jgi:tRNA pseudouridine13 synthase